MMTGVVAEDDGRLWRTAAHMHDDSLLWGNYSQVVSTSEHWRRRTQDEVVNTEAASKAWYLNRYLRLKVVVELGPAGEWA